MTNRIDFPAESFDHLQFERELIENGISYVKSEGLKYKSGNVVSFLFEDRDYPSAVKRSESFPTAYTNYGSVRFITIPERKFLGNFFIIIIIVAAITILVIRMSG